LLSRPDLDQVYERRLPLYEGVSALTIDTDGRRPDAIALEVLAELTRLPSTPSGNSSVFVTPVGGTYYAHIGPGLTDHVDTLLPALPEAERGVIIEASDDTAVAARAAGRFAAAGIATHRVSMPDAQASKTFRAAEHLANVFADHASPRAE
jgi:shikimate kinase/3-dehydroquinate synthase